jgi:hypothetical protein
MRRRGFTPPLGCGVDEPHRSHVRGIAVEGLSGHLIQAGDPRLPHIQQAFPGVVPDIPLPGEQGLRQNIEGFGAPQPAQAFDGLGDDFPGLVPGQTEQLWKHIRKAQTSERPGDTQPDLFVGVPGKARDFLGQGDDRDGADDFDEDFELFRIQGFPEGCSDAVFGPEPKTEKDVLVEEGVLHVVRLEGPEDDRDGRDRGRPGDGVGRGQPDDRRIPEKALDDRRVRVLGEKSDQPGGPQTTKDPVRSQIGPETRPEGPVEDGGQLGSFLAPERTGIIQKDVGQDLGKLGVAVSQGQGPVDAGFPEQL